MYNPLLAQEMHRTGNLEGKVRFVLDGDRLQGSKKRRTIIHWTHSIAAINFLAINMLHNILIMLISHIRL